ncbi:MAG TPA: DUF72 domain-containing protein [Candidatus Angelobacter sp.]|jgi:uncharacterized protein YecE (DUF72 family)
MQAKLYIGTAGWNVPGIHVQHFSREGSHLVRYGKKLNCAEINSCFYREHKPETYQKWAASVPESFCFAVKAPRTITHEGELQAKNQDALVRFLQQTSALGEKRGPVLLQLPPKLAFTKATVVDFFSMFRALYQGPAVLEPRHVSWFGTEPDSILQEFNIARVAADPALAPQAAQPSGWPGLVYFRLHGSPRRYYSAYSHDFLTCLAEKLSCLPRSTTSAWCIFDNTASGAALGNALELILRIKERSNRLT